MGMALSELPGRLNTIMRSYYVLNVILQFSICWGSEL
jgi:hypothetical protein